MNNKHIINYAEEIPAALEALRAVYKPLSGHGVDPKLLHLLRLRASQINNCEFCVKMHLKEARADGETNDRLDSLIVWRHVDDFTPAEKAALEWTEALTIIDTKAQNGAAMREELRKHFNDKQITVLITEIAMINLWNRVRVSMH